MTIKGLRLLVVDDDEEDFILVRGMLASTAELHHVPTIEAALERLDAVSFDLLLLDYRLGAASGLDLLREVRRRGIDLPVIFLTGRGDEEIAVEAFKSGACDYLVKGKLTEPALSRAVNYAVQIHRNAKLLEDAHGRLRASEEKFRALIENISDTVAVLDGAGVVLYANASGAFGYSDLENVGRSGFELIHPEDLDRVRQLYLDCVRSPEGRARAEFRVRHKDGSWRDVEATAANHLGHPAIQGIIVSYHDITDRKRAEQALRLSDEIVRHAGAIILACNSRGEITYASDSVTPLLGYEPSEILGERWWRKTFADPQAGLNAQMALARSAAGSASPSLTSYTREIRHKNGSLRWILWHDTKGPDDLVIGVGHDVTDLKEAEEKLRLQGKALEAAANAIVITDREGIIRWVNPAFERLTGYSLAEAQGQTPRLLKSGEQGSDFYKNLWDTILAGNVWHGELVNKRKDGSKFVDEMTITPLKGEDGSIRNFIGVKQDITEQRRLRDQLLQAQKMEAVGRLSGGVAHDFNNILGVILGYSDLLAERIPEFDPMRRQVEQIHRAGERAASLTRQLLAFSRQQVLQPVVFNLNLVVSEMDKMLHRLIGEDIEITTELAPNLANIRADRSQVEQIVMNLAVNARDAMPTGGRLLIETRNCMLDEIYAQNHSGIAAGPYVMLAVTDTGVGMAKEVQAHVFEPFFTTKDIGKGTGLGLATVYGIVQQSGGHVWVYSEPGKGTTFKIYLPSAGGTAIEFPSEPFASESRGHERILLVEDSGPLRELTRDLLRSCGYEVIVAEDGEQAVDIAEGCDPFDLLITDVVMPGMNGPELARMLQQAHPDTQVLYISGYTDHAVLKNGKLDRDAAFLQKPYTRHELSRKVRELLNAVPAASVAR